MYTVAWATSKGRPKYLIGSHEELHRAVELAKAVKMHTPSDDPRRIVVVDSHGDVKWNSVDGLLYVEGLFNTCKLCVRGESDRNQESCTRELQSMSLPRKWKALYCLKVREAVDNA